MGFRASLSRYVMSTRAVRAQSQFQRLSTVSWDFRIVGVHILIVTYQMPTSCAAVPRRTMTHVRILSSQVVVHGSRWATAKQLNLDSSETQTQGSAAGEEALRVFQESFKPVHQNQTTRMYFSVSHYLQLWAIVSNLPLC